LILDTIVEYKLEEVAERKRSTPLWELKAALRDEAPVRHFTPAITRPPGAPVRIIAEVKKASPSKGLIRADFEPVEIARTYEANGASAISVVTDERFFRGSLCDLTDVKNAAALPVLRKDFIVDEYQIYESRAAGADAALLIVAILSPDELRSYMEIADELGLCCLVEVHNEREMKLAAKVGARVIGINNRDLKTFRVDTSTAVRLSKKAPQDAITVSESGIETRDDILSLTECGIHAALIGESLMRASDIGAKLRELLA